MPAIPPSPPVATVPRITITDPEGRSSDYLPSPAVPVSVSNAAGRSLTGMQRDDRAAQDVRDALRKYVEVQR